MTGARKLYMLAMALGALVVLAGCALAGLDAEVVLGLAGQLPILLGAVVAGNAAEHVARSRGGTP